MDLTIFAAEIFNEKHFLYSAKRLSGILEFSSAIYFVQGSFSFNSFSASSEEILLAACRRFTMTRISDNGSGWK